MRVCQFIIKTARVLQNVTSTWQSSHAWCRLLAAGVSLKERRFHPVRTDAESFTRPIRLDPGGPIIYTYVSTLLMFWKHAWKQGKYTGYTLVLLTLLNIGNCTIGLLYYCTLPMSAAVSDLHFQSSLSESVLELILIDI